MCALQRVVFVFAFLFVTFVILWFCEQPRGLKVGSRQSPLCLHLELYRAFLEVGSILSATRC